MNNSLVTVCEGPKCRTEKEECAVMILIETEVSLDYDKQQDNGITKIEKQNWLQKTKETK